MPLPNLVPVNFNNEAITVSDTTGALIKIAVTGVAQIQVLVKELSLSIANTDTLRVDIYDSAGNKGKNTLGINGLASELNTLFQFTNISKTRLSDGVLYVHLLPLYNTGSYTIDFDIISISQAEYDIFNSFTVDQQDLILNTWWQFTDIKKLLTGTLFNGRTKEQMTMLSVLSPEDEALFPVITVALGAYEQTDEQIAADKLLIEQLTARLRAGECIEDDESVFYLLGNSLMADSAMAIVDSGGGFNGLRSAGFTQTQALRILSIYNIKQDINKYLSETALNILIADPTKIVSLEAFLQSQNPPLSLPTITAYAATIRANKAVYAAIKNWTGA